MFVSFELRDIAAYLSAAACTSANGGRIALAIVLGFLIVIVLYNLSQGQTSETSCFFYFVQTAVLLAGPYSTWVEWLNYFNVRALCLLSVVCCLLICLSQFSPQGASSFGGVCVAPLSSLDHIALNLFVPGLSFVALAIVMGCHFAIAKFGPAQLLSVTKLETMSLSKYLRAAITLFLTSYQQVTVTVMALLNCEIAGPYTVLASYPGLPLLWLAIAICLLWLQMFRVTIAHTCVGVRLRFSSWFAMSFWLRLQSTCGCTGIASKSVYVTRSSLHRGAYFLKVRATHVAFECSFLQLSHQPHMHGCLSCSFVEPHSLASAQSQTASLAMAFSFANSFFLLLHLAIRPYRYRSFNVLEGVSLLLSLVSSVVAAHHPYTGIRSNWSIRADWRADDCNDADHRVVQDGPSTSDSCAASCQG